MGRWGMSLEEALTVPRERVVGVMSHLATADEADEAFARGQIERFREVAAAFPGRRHTWRTARAPCAFPRRASTPSAAASRSTASRRSATTLPATASSRLSPGGATWRSCGSFAPGRAPATDAASWRREPARVGIVPVGYADGFRRGLTGTEVLVGGARRRVVGTVSMDAISVELEDEQAGAPR